MKVMKFGGTSVGSAARIKDVAALIVSKGKNIVVLSAMSGTTNALVRLHKAIADGETDAAGEVLDELSRKYAAVIDELFTGASAVEEAGTVIGALLDELAEEIRRGDTPGCEGRILAKGELISTNLMWIYLKAECGVNAVLLPALDFMRITDEGEPDLDFTRLKLPPMLADSGADLFITQGFICRDMQGAVTNLQRGGSDYSASLIGAATGADEIEIWTDIDGMHDNDPRFVDGTHPVHRLHFEEAAELAYFGAKILHPTCVQPAKAANIPVRLLNTMDPSAPGTIIYNEQTPRRIKAVAAKDNITAIKIKSGRMLLAYGFLRRVFEVFETYRTPIDLIATSEVGVSLTIDNDSHLREIVDELQEFGSVTVDRDMVIVSVVGDLEWHNCGFEAAALDALRDIPVRIISYGGSNYNISFLIAAADKVRALRSLSRHLFSVPQPD